MDPDTVATYTLQVMVHAVGAVVGRPGLGLGTGDMYVWWSH